ncbi:MAG: CidA/LrgA family protein [Hahellaceae bacterium]|nr:CidA/LrgA family protein [Hahellaceae bacterium]
MLNGILALLLCQLAGELLVVLTHLPVPGPVMGMVLLLALVKYIGSVPSGLRQTAEGLLRHLALLYVPAGVGLMTHFGAISQHGAVLILALILSTAAAMAVTALIFKALLKRLPPAASSPDEELNR